MNECLLYRLHANESGDFGKDEVPYVYRVAGFGAVRRASGEVEDHAVFLSSRSGPAERDGTRFDAIVLSLTGEPLPRDAFEGWRSLRVVVASEPWSWSLPSDNTFELPARCSVLRGVLVAVDIVDASRP